MASITSSVVPETEAKTATEPGPNVGSSVSMSSLPMDARTGRVERDRMKCS
ncbi:hypothetical protein D3C86_2112940 [compost metagenome]